MGMQEVAQTQKHMNTSLLEMESKLVNAFPTDDCFFGVFFCLRLFGDEVQVATVCEFPRFFGAKASAII